jgi:hypothetical protein
MRNSSELVAAGDPQVRAALFCLQDRGLPLPGQILERVGVAQRLVEPPALEIAHFAERWVGDDLLDAATERSARLLVEPRSSRVHGAVAHGEVARGRGGGTMSSAVGSAVLGCPLVSLF